MSLTYWTRATESDILDEDVGDVEQGELEGAEHQQDSSVTLEIVNEEFRSCMEF